jgi:ribonuclease D
MATQAPTMSGGLNNLRGAQGLRRLGVASKLIANVADLEKIALSDNAEVDAMHGWRRQLFGEDALKLKRGEIALVLNGARVEVVEIE